MNMKNIIGTSAKVLKSAGRHLINDKSSLIIAGITIGAVGCIELGAVLTKREAEEKYEGKTPEKCVLREIWDDIGEHVISLGATMGVCALINGFSDEVVLPALKAKYPDKYM